jgi:hypothetical protein
LRIFVEYPQEPDAAGRGPWHVHRRRHRRPRPVRRKGGSAEGDRDTEVTTLPIVDCRMRIWIGLCPYSARWRALTAGVGISYATRRLSPAIGFVFSNGVAAPSVISTRFHDCVNRRPLCGQSVAEAQSMRPDTASFRRHESGMKAALSISTNLIVPRETIRKHLMFPDRRRTCPVACRSQGQSAAERAFSRRRRIFFEIAIDCPQGVK